jgi:hypothetical protein
MTDTFAVVAEIKCTGGAAMDAHLAFDTTAEDIVWFSEFAFFIESDFGNHKNGNTPGSFRIAFNSGQYRMDNVRGQIMIAARNEAFGTDDREGAVGISFSGGL